MVKNQAVILSVTAATRETENSYWIDWDNAAPDWRVADELRKV